MKAIFEAEDSIIGVICGLLLIFFTGKFFALKLASAVYAISFLIYALFILLDTVNELRHIASYFRFVIFSLFHNLMDFIIALTFISYFAKLNIAYITTTFTPYLQNESTILYAGIFLVIGNLIWLIITPFID